ncbi:MAG: YhfC family intramembrane metalloprotease [Anaerolineae bacterium]|nr:YhfC family intramembrane metalloprotease [Anaerolineae bacterium]
MSYPLLTLIIIEIVLMVGIPVALAWRLSRRWGEPWRLLLAGAATFVGSQVVHLPLNAGLTALFQFNILPPPPEAIQLPFNAVVLGLTAGICEEVARYLTYRFWQKEARTWKKGVMLGVGHGGIEAILLGGMVLLTLINMSILVNVDSTSFGNEVAEQVTAFWNTPLYHPLLAIAERIMAITLHIALSTLVLQTFTRNKLWPLWAAIGWHALVDATAVYVMGTWGILATEGIMVLLTLGSVGILWHNYKIMTEENQKLRIESSEAKI